MTPPSPVIQLAIAELVAGPKVRDHLDSEHVARLAEVLDDLPPILARRLDEGGYAILGGEHRVEAHRSVGLAEIAAQVVECDDAEALRLAIQDNRDHGQPLTLAEKRANARRLAEVQPELSDRSIGRICGLHHTTVATLRPTGGNSQLDKKAGADGKKRPAKAKAKEQRAAAEEYAEEHPEATVTDIAEQTGVSRGTAGNIKKARTQAERWVDAIEQYPYLEDVPERFQGEALAGVAALDTLDSTERPKREANFEKWARSRPEAEAAIEANALREKAERASSELLDAIAETHRALSGFLTRHGDLPAGHEALHDVPQAAADLIASLREIPNPERLRSVQ